MFRPQAMGDGLFDSLRNTRALCVQVADEFFPFDWFATTLQVCDDRVQDLRTNDKPQFWINVFHNLCHRAWGYPRAFKASRQRSAFCRALCRSSNSAPTLDA